MTESDEEFVRRLLQETPRAAVTRGLVGLNVLVWIATVVSGVDPFTPSAEDLLELGGNMLDHTQEEPWRLFTSTVLHGGAIHLMFNMWVLWDTGQITERFYGNVQFLLIYLLSGMFASLTSLFFAAQAGVSVGASGAIFGVVGALLAALFTKHRKLPRRMVMSLRSSILMFVGYSLLMGMLSTFIDNAAHVGGLVSGFVIAVILAEKFDHVEYRRSAITRAIAAVVASMAAGLAIWKMLPVPSA